MKSADEKKTDRQKPKTPPNNKKHLKNAHKLTVREIILSLLTYMNKCFPLFHSELFY